MRTLLVNGRRQIIYQVPGQGHGRWRTFSPGLQDGSNGVTSVVCNEAAYESLPEKPLSWPGHYVAIYFGIRFAAGQPVRLLACGNLQFWMVTVDYCGGW